MFLDYIYYKLYRASEKSSLSDIPEFIAPSLLGCLLSINFLVVSALLAKFDILPFFFANKYQGGFFTGIAILLPMAFYRKDRYMAIIRRYSKESDEERIRGNLIIASYVAISFLSIFAVAFFRPGKI